jgi:hypothetical protein
VQSSPWPGVGSSNSTAGGDWQGIERKRFQAGGIIGEVTSFGEKAAGENRFHPPFRLRIRQPASETRAKAAPHGAVHQQGDDSRRVEVASSAGFEPTAPGLGILCSILLSYEDTGL